jgi:hypothetical protein
VEKESKEQASDEGKATPKAGSKLNLSPQEVEEVLAVLRYRTRPATPPLKDQLGDPALTVNMALVKGPSLPKTFLEKGAKTKKLHESKQTSGHCVVDKADKLLQAILRPSQEGNLDQAEGQTKPSGLERLKHLFNKTISVSGKEVANVEVRTVKFKYLYQTFFLLTNFDSQFFLKIEYGGLLRLF